MPCIYIYGVGESPKEDGSCLGAFLGVQLLVVLRCFGGALGLRYVCVREVLGVGCWALTRVVSLVG